MDDQQGGLKARLPAELDRLLQLGQFGIGELLGLPEALLLGPVVAGQFRQPVDIVPDLARRRIEARQVPLLAGQDEPRWPVSAVSRTERTFSRPSMTSWVCVTQRLASSSRCVLA